ncbi:MAG: pyrroloquinoline-quinone synthase PqqC [Candidatus Acidiferrales bacterium]
MGLRTVTDPSAKISMLLTPAELEARLRQIGADRYHHQHPFHLLMHEGKLSRGQMQAWALNRYYYQSQIPIKDATILARTQDPELRRAWRSRIIDHDGDAGGAGPSQRPGGVEKWLALVEAAGLSREQAIRYQGVLPAVRYAVDAYIQFVARKSLLEAVASSLTEMFAGSLIALRMDSLRKHYPWLVPGLAYFEGRITQAPADAAFALRWATEHAKTREDQELVCDALRAKCDILWAQLDALYFAYVQPGWPPPGAFRPENFAPEGQSK